MFSKYVESVLAHIGFLPLLQNRQERMLYFSSRVSDYEIPVTQLVRLCVTNFQMSIDIEF